MSGLAVPVQHFDGLYAANADPWHFLDSNYEQQKYRATLAAIGRRRFVRAAELGCSIGVFTHALAKRCDRLLAVDFSTVALDRARARCANDHNVSFIQATLPGEFPTGRFDLIVISEVLYFLAPTAIRIVARRTAAALRPGGTAVLVNYLGRNAARCGGNTAAATFVCCGWFTPVRRSFRPHYRLDVLRRDVVPASE